MSPDRFPSEAVDPAALAQELQFNCGKTASNRFLKAGMSEHLGTWSLDISKRGFPTERLINAYEKWGSGGYGVIVTGNIPVCPNHLQLAGNTLICQENDGEKLRELLRRWSRVSQKDGALAIAQLTHAGAVTPFTLNPSPLAPSDIHITSKKPLSKYGQAKAMSEEQIKDVIARFVFAAKVAYDTGFNGVEVYAAHGFLLSQFLSPATNQRIDKYGGSPENRIRIVLEIYDAIREALPSDFVVGVKMNSVEFQDQGLQTEDARVMCQLIEERDFDFVELSGGTAEKPAFFHQRESTRAREAFFLEFTDQIRPVFKRTKVYVTGGFRTAGGMVAAIESGSTHGIGLARPVAAEPDLPKKILSGEVLAAINNKFAPDDYRITAVAAVAQLALMGKRSLSELSGRVTGDIPDFSRQDEADHFEKAVVLFVQQMAELAQKDLPVDLILEYETLHVY